MTARPVFRASLRRNPRRDPLSDTRHGITRTDDYGWMRAENWQDVFRDPSTLDPAIRIHLEAENAYQSSLMADTKDLQERLFDEMKGRIKEDDFSVPPKTALTPTEPPTRPAASSPAFSARRAMAVTRPCCLTAISKAKARPISALPRRDHSPDHSKMIWGFDDKGSEFFTLKVRDLATLQDTAETVSDTSGGGVWNAQSNGFYYTRVDANHRPSRLFYHKLGQPESEDRLIHEEKDPGFFLGVGGSTLNDFVFIDIHDHETSEMWLLPANDDTAEPKLVIERQTGVEYSLTEGGDVFYILTNADGAKDFKIMSAPVNAPEKANWTEIVAHKPGRLLLGHSAYSNHLVWLERENGLPRIIIRDRHSGEQHSISFDEEAYALGLQGSAEYDTEIIRFSYSSMTTPTQLYDYNMRTRERTLLKTQEVPSGHNPDDYVTRRLLAPAPDGEIVPISIVYHRDTKIDGSAPCLLYGYGSYGITIPASFNTNCLSLADRGFIYAIAHIRGGKDKGYDWYENGKRLKKMNTFTDFIAASEHLVAEGFTSH